MSIDLLSLNCTPISDKSKTLDADTIKTYLSALAGKWKMGDNSLIMTRHFKNYLETMAFVNAVASIANQQDHHPELLVTYNTCTIHYTTHVVDALTINDFICAARIDFITADAAS